MKAADIPTKFPIAFASSAGGSYVRTIPVNSQIGITDGAASLETGFPPLNFLPISSGGVPPFGQDMNGILKEISQWTQWGNAGGPVPYDGTFSTNIGGYPSGAIVASATTAGTYWLSTADDNTTNPDSGGAGWTQLNFITGAGQIWHIGSASAGTSSALTTTLAPTVKSTDTNFFFAVPITTTNTLSGGATTINWGYTAKTVVDNSTGANIIAGELLGAVDYVAIFYYDGTFVRLMNNPTASQPVLQANKTYYVNASTGSDSNNGLTSGTAFATLQKAVDVINSFNLNGYGVTVNVANGTYAQTTLRQINGTGSIYFQGNSASPSSVVISSTLGSCLKADGCNGYTIDGFKVTTSAPDLSTGDPGAGFFVTSASSLFLKNINFGACQGFHTFNGTGSTIVFTGSLTISGGLTPNAIGIGASFYSNGGFITWPGGTGTEPTLTISTSVSIPYFILATSSGQTSLLFGSITGASNVTGSKYLAALNGVIYTAGAGVNYYPGSTAGSTQTGGQYV